MPNLPLKTWGPPRLNFQICLENEVHPSRGPLAGSWELCLVQTPGEFLYSSLICASPVYAQ